MFHYNSLLWKVKIITISLLVLITSQLYSQSAHNLQRTKWFKESRFGMFIHWGSYSLKGFEASWPLFQKLIPMEEYEALAAQFNPVKFDAEKIVKLAQDAGMKYIIFTSKHHDGFAMFNTSHSGYSIMNAPYGKDIVKQLVDACHKADMRVGFYFSLCDWHHPAYRDKSRPFPEGCRPDGAPEDTWHQFLSFMNGQLRELCTNYGKIDVIWFDGGWERTTEQWQSKEIDRMIRSIQPGILINNRHLLDEEADFGTPEQFVPTGRQKKLWETCMTINHTWAYNQFDHDYKSTRELVQNLARTAGGGGNFLLNIGPMPTGEVQPEFVERLKGIGEWMEVNGESIYGTEAGPLRLFRNGLTTVKGSNLYLHILEGPDGPVMLRGIKNPVISARVLRTGQLISFEQEGLYTILKIPYGDLDPYDTVVKIELSGELEYDPAIYPDEEGKLVFPASLAEIGAGSLSYTLRHKLISYSYKEDVLINWSAGANEKLEHFNRGEANEYVRWECKIPEEGKYRVILNHEGDPVTLALTVQDKTRFICTEKTNRISRYKDVYRGVIHLYAGKAEVFLRAETVEENSNFKFRQMLFQLVRTSEDKSSF